MKHKNTNPENSELKMKSIAHTNTHICRFSCMKLKFLKVKENLDVSQREKAISITLIIIRLLIRNNSSRKTMC